MDFEERIERLTGRHETLAQSLEMLAIDVREMQVATREFQTAMREFEATTGKRIESLLRIAEIQHEKTTRIEGGAA